MSVTFTLTLNEYYSATLNENDFDKAPRIDKELSKLFNEATEKNYLTWDPKELLASINKKPTMSSNLPFAIITIVLAITAITLPILGLSTLLIAGAVISSVGCVASSAYIAKRTYNYKKACKKVDDQITECNKQLNAQVKCLLRSHKVKIANKIIEKERSLQSDKKVFFIPFKELQKFYTNALTI